MRLAGSIRRGPYYVPFTVGVATLPVPVCARTLVAKRPQRRTVKAAVEAMVDDGAISNYG